MSKTVCITTAEIKWTIQRSTGYNVCNLYVNDKKVASCNGGGYDMVGTVFGDWVAKTFPELLRTRIKKTFSGLSFHNPNFDPSKAEVPGTGKTVEELEKTGESLGLDRYQAACQASSRLPTEVHTVPYIDGAYGFEAVTPIFEAIGGGIKQDRRTRNDGAVYNITMPS
jgi:hypothetical protein